MKFINIHKGSQNENTTLYGFKNIGGKTVWSRTLDSSAKDAVNYIQAKFRILPENKTGKDSAGIKWKEGNTVYVVYITSGGLELRQQTTNDNRTSLLFQNAEIDKNDGIWYLLKVASLKDSIEIYTNSEPKIKVPKIPSEGTPGNISKVGINSVNNAVEYEPIQIGRVPSSEQFYDRKMIMIIITPLASWLCLEPDILHSRTMITLHLVNRPSYCHLILRIGVTANSRST